MDTWDDSDTVPHSKRYQTLLHKHNMEVIALNNKVSLLQQENNAIVKRWSDTIEEWRNRVDDLQETHNKKIAEHKGQFNKAISRIRVAEDALRDVKNDFKDAKDKWEAERDMLLCELVRLRGEIYAITKEGAIKEGTNKFKR